MRTTPTCSRIWPRSAFTTKVQVKGFDSMLVRTLVAARNQLLKMTTRRSNQILMKRFGLVVPKGAGRVFESHLRRLLASNAGLEQIILPVLEAWRGMRTRTAELSKRLVASARVSEQCQLLCSIPGVGAVTASSFVAAIEDPEKLQKVAVSGRLDRLDHQALPDS